MVHEAMILEYSGRHLAVLEAASSLNLLLYVSLISSIFFPWGLANANAAPADLFMGFIFYVGKLLVSGCLLAAFETSIAKMRVFRVPQFIGTALMMALLAALLMFVTRSL
jgi:formate hydrogenlyase subunit 4